jgi:molecular chaperone IbpA
MRTFDLSPLYRSTVGFDRLFSMLDQAASAESAPTYPPYNIERTAEDAYRITVAAAGFASDELSVETAENTLVIRGQKLAVEGETHREVLHQGIAARAFERRFQLADHMHVTGADLAHGLLHVDLVREIPEAKKPRQIAIGDGAAKLIAATPVAANASDHASANAPQGGLRLFRATKVIPGACKATRDPAIQFASPT